MKIKTRKFGPIDIEEDKIVAMPDGMLGFPDKRKYVLAQKKETDPFCLFQSIEDPDVGFFILNPYLFYPEYEIPMGEAIRKMKWNGDEKEISCFVVVNIPGDAFNDMTANMIGPILINTRKKAAVQLILPDAGYSHQHPVLK